MKFNALNWFFIGFLTESICWRIDQHKYDSIAFPIGLLIIYMIIIVFSQLESTGKSG